MYELTVRTEFSAAHQLRGYEGPCEQMHGHNWVVETAVRCPGLDDRGLAMDFKVIREKTRHAFSSLDHSLLNERPPFDRVNPSAENIARHLFTELSAGIAEAGASLYRVTVYETPDASASYVEDGHVV